MTEPSPLFDHLPDGLFSPLASPRRELNWSVLATAFGLHQQAGPGGVTKDELLDHIESELVRAAAALDVTEPDETDEMLPADLAGSRLFAWRVLRRLERAGWFRYEYRRGDGFVLQFPDYAARLMATLGQIAAERQPEVRGLAYNIHAVLTDDELRETDPAFVLSQATAATAALRFELKTLADRIGDYTERFSQGDDAAALLRRGIAEFQAEVVEPSWQRFKTGENALRFRLAILERLDELLEDPLFAQGAAAGIERDERRSSEDALAEVYRRLESLREEFDELDVLIESVDERHARYATTLWQRVRHSVLGDHATEACLAELVARLAAAPDDDEELWEALVSVPRIEVVTADSLYDPPHAAGPRPKEAVAEPVLSKDRRRRLREVAPNGRPSPLSPKTAYAVAQAKLSRRDAVPLAEFDPADDGDLLALIALHAHRFREDAPYRITTADGQGPLIHRGRYAWRDGILVRRPQNSDAQGERGA
jgi:hypothetical protein